jgi:hypothetical protein
MHPDNLDGSCYVHINDNATDVQDGNDSGGGISDSDSTVTDVDAGADADADVDNGVDSDANVAAAGGVDADEFNASCPIIFDLLSQMTNFL